MSRVFVAIWVVLLLLPAIVRADKDFDWDSETVSAKDLMELAKKIPEGFKDSTATVLDKGVFIYKKNGRTFEFAQFAEKLMEGDPNGDESEGSFDYNSYYEKLLYYRVETILPSGKVVVLPDTDYEKEKTELGMASVNYHFPSVKKSCILNYVFVKEYVKDIMPNHMSGNWSYWVGTPVVQCTLILDYPTNKPFQLMQLNNSTKEVTTPLFNGARTRKTWTVQKLDPMEEEYAMPDEYELSVRTIFTTTLAWTDISKWYSGLTSNMTSLDASSGTALDVATKDAKTDMEKAAAIWKYVVTNFRYVAVTLGTGTHKPHSPSEVFAKKYGDCKDQSLFLVTALKRYGIKSWLVLLHAGDQIPFTNELPTLDAFNHVIVCAEIDGKRFWLDPSAGKWPIEVTPNSAQGVQVLLVREDGGEIISIPKEQEGSLRDMKFAVHLDINEDGSETMKTVAKLPRFAMLTIKEFGIDPDEKKQVEEYIKSSTTGESSRLKDVKIDFPDPTSSDEGVITVTGRLSTAGQTIGDLLIVKAISNQEDDDIDMKHYVGENGKRDYPFVYPSASDRSYELYLTFPKGWSIVENLSPYSLKGPGRVESQVVDINGNTIHYIMREQTFKMNEPLSALDKIVAYEKELVKARKGKLVLRMSKQQ